MAKSISKARQWQMAQFPLPKHFAPPLEESRVQAITARFICNVDAAWNAITFNCGIGWVLISGETSSVYTASDSCCSVSSALVAETRAMMSAMIYSVDMGCYHITVRSDSQTLIRDPH